MLKHQKQPTKIVFKRWSRKSFAVYNSLHKVVCIGVLGLTCSMVNAQDKQHVLRLNNRSQDSIAYAKELEEVEIAVDASLPPILNAVAPVVSSLDIARTPVQNVQDLLRTGQGIDLRTRGTEGVQADISIQGGTFDQTIVLLNGINITDPQTGHHSSNIPVSIHALEKIEISKGKNSVGGTVNFITKQPEQSFLNLNLSSGQYGYLQGSGCGSITHKNVYAFLDAGYNQSDGYTDNTDFKIGNIYGVFGVKSNRYGHLEFMAGNIQKKYGANSFYSAKYKEQYEETTTGLYALKYEKSLGRNFFLDADLYYLEKHDKFELFRYEAPAWYGGHNYHFSKISGLDVGVKHYQYDKRTSFLTINFRNEQLLSSGLGDSLPHPIKDPKDAEGIFYYGKNRIYGDLATGQSYYFREMKWNADWQLKGSMNNHYGIRLYSGGSLKYNPHNTLVLGTSIHHAYRMPTFTDLYYKSPTQTGNPDLKPEEAVYVDLSAQMFDPAKKWQGGLSAFYRYGFKTIDWVRSENQEVWHAMNFTDIQAQGFEVFLLYKHVDKKTSAYSFIKQMKLGYTWLNTSKNTHGYLSLYVTDYLRNQIKFSLTHLIYKNLSASWDFHFNDRNGHYFDIVKNAETSYKPYLLCNLKINYDHAYGSFFAEATNLFNTTYCDIGNLPQAGIWIKAGINFYLNTRR